MPSQEEIIAKVEEQKLDRQDVQLRMDLDYSLWRLDKYPGGEGLEDFRTYTSPEPRSFANKVQGLLSSAKPQIRAEDGARTKDERRTSNNKERFTYGMFRAGDERLRRLRLPSLHDQLGWHTTIRGEFAVRAVLAKREDGSTYTDIMPFDPYSTYWEMGQDGPQWVCHVIRKTNKQIKALYGVEANGGQPTGSVDAGADVYDYYDGTANTLFLKNHTIKRPTPHGAGRVPVAMGYVGPTPPTESFMLLPNMADYGESIYQASRDAYAELNYAISAMSEFVKRSLKQPYIIEYGDGSMTLAENPYLSGAQISIPTGAKVYALDSLTMAQETGVYLGLVTGDIQRGTLPHSAFGDIQFQLSGFAINSLRQGMATVVEPPRLAMVSAYTQIAELLVDQYVTGQFSAMELSGFDSNRDYFKAEITPEEVKAGGDLVIDLPSRLPQDDVAALAMATQLTEGANPLASQRYAREEVLGMRDSDQMESQVLEQMAGRATPMAAAFRMMEAALEMGEMELAQIWMLEAQKQSVQAALEMQILRMQAQGLLGGGPSGAGAPSNGNGSNGVGGRGGFDPRVATGGMLGRPPPTPTPQIGPINAPGQPRPGAQNGLARLGLFGPNG